MFGLKLKIKEIKKKRGRKRKKYETPHKEHPETKQIIKDHEIHANHVEAFNASLRRRLSAYRRKTNTYVKSQPRLQRILDIYWIIYNFVRPHHSTNEVPAVLLGVIKTGFTLEFIFCIQRYG